MEYSLINNLKIKIQKLKDLSKLKIIMDSNDLKPNYSALSKELGVDRRTIKKYYHGYEKPFSRNKSSKIDKFKDVIKELLDVNSVQRFYSKTILWRYLKDNHALDTSLSNFNKYINNNEVFKEYFDKNKGKSKAKIRFESSPSEQAQIDWKENIEFITSDGEIINLNIFVFILSYSRYRIFSVSLDKKQSTLFDFLNSSFEQISGVPQSLVTDNMKTIMDEPRTGKKEGKVNNKFYQFMKDYGFDLKPCTARRPQTKGKVESSMKLLEEINAYQGKLTYQELLDLVSKINNRVNLDIHQGTGQIPIKLLEKEKDFLKPLPSKQIRNLYKIKLTQVRVNKSSMITYKKNQYSVPTEYENKPLNLQVLDNKLYVYDNTKLVTIHKISHKKLNYHLEDYKEILSNTLKNKDSVAIKEIAKENLKKIGEIYGI